VGVHRSDRGPRARAQHPAAEPRGGKPVRLRLSVPAECLRGVNRRSTGGDARFGPAPAAAV